MKLPVIEIDMFGFVNIDGLTVMDLNERFEAPDPRDDDLRAEFAANMEAAKAKYGADVVTATLDYFEPEFAAYVPEDEFIITLNPEIVKMMRGEE